MLKTLSILTLLALAIGLTLYGSAPPQDYLQDQQVIGYRQNSGRDPVARLQQRLDRGESRLEFDETNGYLASVLKELHIPSSSQGLVFSKTSFQLHRIDPHNPRAIYFNDDAYVGWVRGGEMLELGAVDPQLGGIFYVLDQTKADRPKFIRNDECLQCHAANNTRNVPGFVVRSVYPDHRGYPISSLGSHVTSNNSPLHERWGGWYVTGTHGEERHAGNLLFEESSTPEKPETLTGANLTSLVSRFSPKGYLTPHSDIVALLVLEHQTQLHNLVTRLNYETRLALHQQQILDEALQRRTAGLSESARRRIERATEDLVRHLLFIGEARWRSPISGTTSFARDFSAAARRDSQGRSLRDLDLKTKLFRYPCSYLIYSDSIASLPTAARDELWRQLGAALTGKSGNKDYLAIPAADRQAVIEILRETMKTGLAD
jgi:hypothetical protein